MPNELKWKLNVWEINMVMNNMLRTTHHVLSIDNLDLV